MNRPLRIVFVAPFGLRHKSTVWARTLPLARELNRMGHTASILVPPWDSPQDGGTLAVRHGVKLEHVTLSGGLPAITARLVQRIRAQSPDIVHIVKPRAYAGIVQFLMWQARQLPAAPRIVLDVDDWEAPWAAINRYPGYQRRFLQWQEEWGIRHAHGVTAASRWLVDRVREAAAETPVLYLPNGVDAPAPLPAHEYALRTPPRLLYLSRFVEVDASWLGALWASILRLRPDAVLLVAGRALHERGEQPFLRALAEAQQGLPQSRVAWLGYVNPEKLPALYSSVDCALFPSDDTALLKAKCSVRLATALQHGVPALASAVGEQAAYGAQGAARLVAAGASPETFAEAVAGVLASTETRRSLGQCAAQRMAANYAWPALAAKLDEFYGRVLRRA